MARTALVTATTSVYRHRCFMSSSGWRCSRRSPCGTPLLEEVTGGPAADGPAPQQLGGDELDGPPVPFLGEEVFRLGQQPPDQALGPALPRPAHGEAADVLPVAGGGAPGVVA